MKALARHRALAALMVGSAALAIGAAPASAQEDGVFVDPNAPAQQEYALPVDRARSEADPTTRSTGRVEQGPTNAQPFGVGIGDGPRGAGSGSGDKGSADPSTASNGRSDRGAARDGGVAPLPRDREVSQLATDTAAAGVGGGSGDMLIVGGAAGLVLLLGGLAGWVLRRHSYRSS